MSSTLAAAAFGPDPGRWPLAAGRTPEQLWMRAVAAGGQGRYAAARADLTRLLRGRPDARWQSLALSTQGSFLRQLGWHRKAHDWDGRAWAAAGAVDSDTSDTEAAVDALIGLAADALGAGRLAASAALLQRATSLTCPGAAARLDIRLAWVHAELAMAGGDGAAAVRHARRGVELAEGALPELRRHRAKSDVVLAAALCSEGDLGGSRALADAALTDTETHRLVPLRWALACLLSDIGSSVHPPAVIAGIRAESAAFVTRHGGDWKMS